MVDNEIRKDVYEILVACVSDEYAPKIMEKVGNEIVRNVMETSGYEDEMCWNDSDIRYAIGRILCDYLAN